MNVLIRKIKIENFKGIKNKEIIFGEKTCIYGANATGKTSILDAFLWCLFGVDSAWNSKFEIRPIDDNGNKIHHIEISVVVELEVNGSSKIFNRVLKENWVLKRGCSERELQGNVGSYFVNEYPRTETEYKREVADLVSEDVFKMLTSPTYFTSLKWKEQRDILMRFVSEINDYDLADSQPIFAPLLAELSKAPSTDDIASKFRKALTEWKHKQAEIPVRIDEAEKSRVVIDVAELELGKKAVQELLKSNQLKQEDVSKQYEEHQKLSDGIMDLKFKLGDLEREANAGLVKQRRDLHGEIEKLQYESRIKKSLISDAETSITSLKIRIKANQQNIETHRDKWTEEKSRVFDDSSLVCPYCKQEYPQDKKDELKAEFESHKAKKLSVITECGNELKEQIDSDKAEMAEIEKKIKVEEEKLAEIEKQIADAEKSLSELPTSIDVSQTDEYKEIQKQIVEKEQAMLKFNSADGIRKQLIEEERELNRQLLDFERRIASAQKNVEIDERIAELQAEQREVGQKVADQEKMLYLLEEFIRYKMDKVSESINGKFELANFILFKNLINGGLVETCECEYNGVPYSSLNSAAKIQCGLDIIRSLQKLYDTYCPVFVDNRESCTDIPTMDCQVISMYVNPEYKEIKIES